MQPRALLAAVLTAGALFVPAAHAQTGRVCGLVGQTDPAGVVAPPDVVVGEMHGGPLASADLNNAGEETAFIELVCAVQVNAPTHAGPDAAWLYGSGTAVAFLSGAVQFFVQPWDSVYVCTQVRVNGWIVRYWDASVGGWSTNPNVPCAQLTSQQVDVGNPLDPGTGQPSGSCASGQVVDNTTEGVTTRLYVQQPGPGETDVCVRVGGYGGKFVITPKVPGVSFGLPSTDGASGACTTTGGNLVPGSHPVTSGGVLGTSYAIDAYATTDAAWVCVNAGTAFRIRVVVPAQVPGVTTDPEVSFQPDATSARSVTYFST